MNLKKQKRLAAAVLKCGRNRVYIDTENIEEVQGAVTRKDIQNLVNQGIITARQKKGISKGRIRQKKKQKNKGRQKGHGSRKGRFGARYPKKERWMNRIRPIRGYLKELRKTGKIDSTIYRKYYRKAKGGEFKSKAHLQNHLVMDGILRSDEDARKEI